MHHPTLHELVRQTPPQRHLHPARRSLRSRRDLALVRLGDATVSLGVRLGAAGRSRGALHQSGAPPSPRTLA